MAHITLAQAALWCGGRVEEKYARICFCGASNDSRTIAPGQLFVALVGVRDGNDYIPAAFEKGAAAVLTSRPNDAYPAIVVDDPRIALGQIAAALRRQIGMQVVGVTGSVGKSTTKEMISAVLEGDYIVSKTPANFNNDLGMPMAILAMPDQANPCNRQLEILIQHMPTFSRRVVVVSLSSRRRVSRIVSGYLLLVR